MRIAIWVTTAALAAIVLPACSHGGPGSVGANRSIQQGSRMVHMAGTPEITWGADATPAYQALWSVDAVGGKAVYKTDNTAAGWTITYTWGQAGAGIPANIPNASVEFTYGSTINGLKVGSITSEINAFVESLEMSPSPAPDSVVTATFPATSATGSQKIQIWPKTGFEPGTQAKIFVRLRYGPMITYTYEY